jgi:hypothetical protein
MLVRMPRLTALPALPSGTGRDGRDGRDGAAFFAAARDVAAFGALTDLAALAAPPVFRAEGGAVRAAAVVFFDMGFSWRAPTIRWVGAYRSEDRTLTD